MSGFSLAAGDLDRRIELIRDGEPAHDGLQTVPGAPAVLAEMWAKVRPGGGQERYANAENAATAPTVFTIRYQRALDPNVDGGISPADRVRYPKGEAGMIYDIKDVTELGRHVAIQIAAVRRVA